MNNTLILALYVNTRRANSFPFDPGKATSVNKRSTDSRCFRQIPAAVCGFPASRVAYPSESRHCLITLRSLLSSSTTKMVRDAFPSLILTIGSGPGDFFVCITTLVCPKWDNKKGGGTSDVLVQ